MDRSGIPTLSGLEMLRHAAMAFREPMHFLASTAQRHGDVVAFPVPGAAALLISDPVAARHILQGNHGNYTKDTIQYRSLSLVTGMGILASDGEMWLRHRRLIQPAFHRRRLGGVAEVSVTATKRAMAQWDRLAPAAVIDVDTAMLRISLEVVGHALFATAFGEGGSGRVTPDALIRAMHRALDAVVLRGRNPLAPPPNFPSPGNLRFARALRTIDAAIGDAVSDRGEAPDDDHALLPALKAGGLDDHAVRDELVTLLIAGHETVASALTWTWHLLGQHRRAAQRLYEEVDDVLGGRPATHADLERLRWTRQVLEESLRLFPPAWAITRRARKSDVACGYPVPAGALVIVSPFVVHRHPRWWTAPGEFRPERFAPEQRPPRAAYLPFGAGPRLCIGENFALVEATLVLATVAQRFAFLPAGLTVHPQAKVTIRPRGGLPMRLIRRERAASANH